MSALAKNTQRLVVVGIAFLLLAGIVWVIVQRSGVHGGRTSGAIAPSSRIDGEGSAVATEVVRDCWRNAKTGAFLAIYPLESDPDPKNPNHRTRPEMRAADGTIIRSADFIRAPDGWWIDALTGQSAINVPIDSTPDPESPTRRLLLKTSDNGGDDIVIGKVERAPCPPVGSPTEAGAAPRLDRENAEILNEINAARTHPRAYAEELLKSSQAPTILEAAAFLENQSPLPPLQASEALAVSAKRHVIDQGRAGARGHIGTDGSTVRERVEDAGLEPAIVGEEIAFAADTGAGVVRQLIIDEGVPDRSHRRSLFNRDLAAAGVACGSHSLYRSMCVIDIAGPTSALTSESRVTAASK